MEEKVISIINQEIKCPLDITKIIRSYYFLISNEFKLELKNIMKDRSDRKLKYIISKFTRYNGHEFVIKSIIYGRKFMTDFFSGLNTASGMENTSKNIRIYYRAQRQTPGKRITNPPNKSFNRLTMDEFLALE